MTRLFLSTMTTQSSLFLLLFTGLWAAQRSSPSSSPLCSQVHSPSLPTQFFYQSSFSSYIKLPRSVSPMYQKPTPVKLPSKSASSARKSICLKRFRSFNAYYSKSYRLEVGSARKPPCCSQASWASTQVRFTLKVSSGD